VLSIASFLHNFKLNLLCLQTSFSDAPSFIGTPVFPELTLETNQNCCESFTGNGYAITTKPIEWDEWVLAEAFVGPESRVLEFGARYGTTSCVVSRATGNKGYVVSVEVDSSVWDYLEVNRQIHKCAFHIVKGSVGDKPLAVEAKKGYGTYSKEAEGDLAGITLPNFNFEEIEWHLGYRFNTLLIDCEACFSQIFQGRRVSFG
jgi:hypothetical protein